MIPASVDLSSAEASYVISNTPLFLIRRLQQDPSARALNALLSGEQILQTYREMVTIPPEDLQQLVTPYLCLASLSLRDSIKHLVKAAAIAPSPEYKWMPYFLQLLIEMYRPVSRQTFKVTNVRIGTALARPTESGNTTYKLLRTS